MAGTRLTGLMSGMDTDSLIEQLMEGRKKKVDVVKKKQKTINYKQEAWKSLNTKLKNLQTKYLSNLRFSTSYAKKVTKVSNPNAASVITGGGAVNGVQSLEINELAKTAYLTGGKLGNDTQKFTALSTMEDLGVDFDGNDTATISVAKGAKTLEITLEKGSTISDVLSKLKDFGLNASFDEKNQRMFISSKESGEENDFTFSGDDNALRALGLKVGEGATKIDGKDAVIKLNGATFTNKTNVFEINGLTITALNETKEGEQITLSTQEDTDGIYDMIKDFLKEYNSVINELDKLYNAENSKLEPLTDEEKDALSDREVEDWEKKLTASILRRDESINDISMAMRNAMSSGIKVGDKTMYLSDFGIATLGYFNAADNEKHAYHIDGDTDDSDTSGNADKLKSMIANEPSTVISFFTKLSQELYGKMTDMSKSVDGYRSFGSFYDDKKMKSEYTNYNTKISDMEKKLNDYEDSWYKKFAKMESAMSKMQSNTSAITSLIGG